MRIDLTLLGPEGIRATETFDSTDLKLDVGSVRDALWEPIRVELDSWVRQERRYVRASGSYEAEARAECDRCLKPVLERVSGEFDLLYRWPDAAGRRSGRSEEHELREEDLSVGELASALLDTRDIAREQVELAAPIQTLCSPTCVGLCPVCGLDRNLGLCNCPGEEPDRRWEGLRNLRMKDER